MSHRYRSYCADRDVFCFCSSYMKWNWREQIAWKIDRNKMKERRKKRDLMTEHFQEKETKWVTEPMALTDLSSCVNGKRDVSCLSPLPSANSINCESATAFFFLSSRDSIYIQCANIACCCIATTKEFNHRCDGCGHYFISICISHFTYLLWRRACMLKKKW